MVDKTKEYIPTPQISKNAKKGLELRKKYGRGGTEVGISRAEQLSKRLPLRESIIKRMSSYFARHEVDKQSANFGDESNPSKGYIAWLLWGGDEAKRWVDEIKKQLNQSK
ncbi:hypothetical protein IM40_03815 [Candidatus Paracaedimonas acanthamoebae]|nr:hypothetical protein IM40_03815 [Candidatus Paracaedimonas acanthamoebae]